jgi:predicted ATP-dependent endonuclease of OLD family
MKIAFVEIQNFRKLKSCRIEFASKESILVGANNSGKTSAMDALILFLKRSRRNDISTTDFTLSNRIKIDKIGLQWAESKEEEKPDLALEQWLPYLPSLDIWLKVNESNIHYVINILPTLDWTPEQLLGIRLLFAPKDIEKLYKEFILVYKTSRKTEQSALSNGKKNLKLWPRTIWDFLDRELRKYFEVNAYILDPQQCCDPENGVAKPQSLPAGSDPLDKDPIENLFKIDIIGAQRGFSDPKTEKEYNSSFSTLTVQLRQYFDKHLNPSESPELSDIEALEAIETANTAFDEKLKTSFKSAIGELEGLNYPGFSDPQITLTSKINVVDGLDHKTAVQFTVSREDNESIILALPEQYNGLGYQNLISMVFRLIRFRDEWMRVGKVRKGKNIDETIIEPLHLVLIEEPEAHLHAQVQQVFIKKAYQVLRKNAKLEDESLHTQLIVSTHSSYIAHELDFSCLRYFRREPAKGKGEIPLATVVNLSKTFGDQEDTSRFAARYIRSTDCDLFFADATILVEGSAERMLIPHFIRHHFPKLDQSYLSILEIGGSHAHRLKPLLETLGIISLIVTDLDSIGESSSAKVFPERNKRYRSGNTTLNKWIPKKESLDELFDCQSNEKQSTNQLIRVAYQCPIKLKYKTDLNEDEAIPYTFEDSLALSNLELFRSYEDPKALLKKIKESLNSATLQEANKKMFEQITANNSNKAGMALELLYLTEPSNLKPPLYIRDGLQWLESKLAELKKDFLVIETKGAKID